MKKLLEKLLKLAFLLQHDSTQLRFILMLLLLQLTSQIIQKMAYVIQIVRKIKLSVPQLIHTYLFTMLHTISIVNLTLKLNFDKLMPTVFF